MSALMVYFLILVAFFVLYFLIPRKQAWIPFSLLVFALATLAFYCEPNDTDDLFRYFRIIDQMRVGGWDRFQEMIQNNEFDFGALPIAGYYFYLISLLPDNHFLPFFTILISYGCMMLIIYKVAQRYKVDKLFLALALFFVLSTYWFYDIYSGTRNGLSFTIALVCIYYHFVERKNIVFCLIGYIIVCGLHSSGILLIALGAVAYLTFNNKSKFVNILIIFTLVGASAGITVLSKISDNEFVQTLSGKTENAVDNLGISFQTNFLVNVATYFVAVLIIAYAFAYIKRYITDKGEKRFFRFVEVIVYFSLGSIVSGLIFVRILRWVIPILVSIVYMVGMQIQKDRLDNGYIDLSYDSDTPRAEKIRTMNKGVTSFFLFAYSSVHLWYDFNGSSLIWLHF